MPQTFSIQYRDLDNKWTASRYRIFNLNSAIGVSEYTCLGDIACINSGLYIKGYKKQGVPYYRVDNIRNLGTNETDDDVVFIDNRVAEEIVDRCKVKCNDILVARTGTIGKAVLAMPFHKGSILSQHVSKITIGSSVEVYPGALTLYLNSSEGSRQLVSLASGSTRLELTHSDLKKLRVPIISLKIQKQYHESLVESLALYYRSIKNIKNLEKDVGKLLCIEDKFIHSKTFSVESSTIDRVWFPKRFQHYIIDAHKVIKKNFTVSTIGEMFDVKRGKGTRSRDYESDGIPYVRTSSLINFSIDPFTDHYANQDTYLSYNQPIDEDIILYSIEGKIGFCALINQDYPVVIKNHIEMLRLIKIPDGFDRQSFLGWSIAILRSIYGRVQVEQNRVTQSTIPSLASRLREFVIPIEHRKNKTVAQDIGLKYFNTNRQLFTAIIKLQQLQKDFNKKILSQSN